MHSRPLPLVQQWRHILDRCVKCSKCTIGSYTLGFVQPKCFHTCCSKVSVLKVSTRSLKISWSWTNVQALSQESQTCWCVELGF